MLRYLTGGESHGLYLTVIIEGLPAGLPLGAERINMELARRQKGYGRGERMLLEKDEVQIIGGVRGGLTLGSPVVFLIKNQEGEAWQEVLAPHEAACLTARVVTRPRPGHADLAGGLKYRHRDLRNVLERASARETAARVVAGTCARLLLEKLGVGIWSHVVQIGRVRLTREPSLDEIKRNVSSSLVACALPEFEQEMLAAIDEAQVKGDTLGGVFELVVTGLPLGLGSYAHGDRRLDGQLAQALMSIPAVKGVEIGLGFEAASRPGSQAHDEIFWEKERGFFRKTNRAGGLEGGVTNGELLVLRAAVKPVPTLKNPLQSVDLATKEPAPAAAERADVCVVPAAGVVGEAEVAFVLARAFLEKFGGDHLAEIKERVRQYEAYLQSWTGKSNL